MKTWDLLNDPTNTKPAAMTMFFLIYGLLMGIILFRSLWQQELFEFVFESNLIDGVGCEFWICLCCMLCLGITLCGICNIKCKLNGYQICVTIQLASHHNSNSNTINIILNIINYTQHLVQQVTSLGVEFNGVIGSNIMLNTIGLIDRRDLFSYYYIVALNLATNGIYVFIIPFTQCVFLTLLLFNSWCFTFVDKFGPFHGIGKWENKKKVKDR